MTKVKIMSEEYGFLHPAFDKIIMGGADLGDADLVVIGLHGRGGGEQRIFDSMALAYSEYEKVTYITPSSINGYWWDDRLNTNPYDPDLLLAMSGLTALIDDLGKKGFSSNQISLTGISQGSSFAAEYVARESPGLHSTVLMAGALPGLFYSPQDQADVYNKDLSGEIVRLSWNKGDVIMPFDLMVDTQEKFNSWGAEVDFAVHPGGSHNITKGDREVLASLTGLTRGSDRAESMAGTSQGDLLYGLAGDDSVTGLDREDVLIGGDGRDTLRGLNDNDRLWGGDENDRLFGGDGDDTLFGEHGDDQLIGNFGNDALYGRAGDDLIQGGNGDDSLMGGLGSNTLFGGEGADVFVFEFDEGANFTIIEDFQTGIDKILVSGADYSAVDQIEFSMNDDRHVQIEFGQTTIVVDDPISTNDGLMILEPDLPL